MASRRHPHDRRDRLQRHALPAVLARRRRHRPGPHHHRLPRRLRNVHLVAPGEVQDEPPGGPQYG